MNSISIYELSYVNISFNWSNLEATKKMFENAQNSTYLVDMQIYVR